MLELITKRAALAVAGASIALSSNADAQVGGLISVYNDYRFRGVSLSGGRPVAILDLSYDLRTGLYAALSGRVVATAHEGVKPLGFSLNAGYARTILPALNADVGIVHSAYSHYSGLATGRSYTEAYAGLTGKIVGARLWISPDYLGSARWTAYGEIFGHVDLSGRTDIEAGLGALTGLERRYGRSGRRQVDARLGLAQRIGPVRLHAMVTAQGRDYVYTPGAHHKLALMIGASTAL